MITSNELRRITRDTISENIASIKETIMRPLEAEIEAAAIECAKANQPYVCRKFTLHKALPAILYAYFTQEYLPVLLSQAGFDVENIELEMRDGGFRLLTLEFNWR